MRQFRRTRSPAPALAHNRIFNHLVDDCARAPHEAGMEDRPEQNLDLAFAALADPTRRAILARLSEGEASVTELAKPFEISQPAISKHLGILTRAGLISQEKRGRVKWCKLEPDALRDASIWMQSFGQFEAVNLDAFEAFLDAELDGEPR